MIQNIQLTPGFCGKKGRCYNKDCSNKTVCMIGHKVITKEFSYHANGMEITKVEVHRQWE